MRLHDYDDYEPDLPQCDGSGVIGATTHCCNDRFCGCRGVDYGEMECPGCEQCEEQLAA